MSQVGDRLREVLAALPEGVRLDAVSKFHPVELLRDAYAAGQRRFAESRVQELLQKEPEMPADVEWHFIGHLQTNKVKQLIGRTSLIESVDSERLLNLIDLESVKAGIVTRVLLQVHVAREETKFGMSRQEIMDYFLNRKFETLKSTHICGVMGMASNTDDLVRVRADFHEIADIYKEINALCPDLRGFDTLSMGMSHDWHIAVEEGSNLVRIGSAIFGDRQY